MNLHPYTLSPAIKVLTFFAVILTFFVRPFSLGLDNSLVSNALLLTVTSVISISTPATLYNRKSIFLVLFIIYLIFGLYMTLFGGDGMAIMNVVQLISVYLMFKNYSVMHLYFKYLRNIFLVLIVLAIINFILECNVPDRSNLAILKDITYQNKSYEFSLYFPLSWSKMGWIIGGNLPISGVHNRQYYFFVEPGMAPPFFTAFIFMIWNNDREKRKWIKTIIFLIGILLTFSTGGPLILFLSLAVWYASKHRKKFSITSIVLFALGISFAWYAYNYMPVFGRMAKVEYTAGAAESIETHENVTTAVAYGVVLLVIYGLMALKLKKDKVMPVVFTAIVALGYMSNYVGYTTLATMILFWDKYPQIISNRKPSTVMRVDKIK